MSRYSARGKKWDMFRLAMKKRADNLCERCGRAGRLEVHHITPVSKGGAMYHPDNVIVICRACHFDEHRNDKPAQNPVRRLWWKMIETL